MKAWILLLLGVISFSTFAKNTRLVCATYSLTSSYVLNQTDTGFELEVVHHNGLKYVPIGEGLVTSSDLDVLKARMDLISDIGDRYVVKFTADQCQNRADKWVCSNPNPLKIGKLKVKNIWFKVAPKKVISDLGVFESYAVRFSFGIGSQGITLPMEYGPRDCTFH